MSLFFLISGIILVQNQHFPLWNKHITLSPNKLKGLIAIIISSLVSGFSGIYFEKVLKETLQSIWIRNIQLGLIGVIFGTAAMEVKDGIIVHRNGFFYGYNYLVWFIVLLQSFGGLLVAVVVKYADNISKNFATSAAIIISCLASVYLFNFEITFQFIIGMTIVLISIYMYTKHNI